MMDKIQPQSIREQVFHKLRKEILQGHLQPNEKLIESELAKSLAVSRTPVREALHRLEQEGLIKIYPRKYCLVKGITDDCIREINLIRAALEPTAAKEATYQLTESELQRLARLIDESEVYAKHQDVQKLLQVHDAFHETIINASKLPRIIQILANMHDYIVRFRLSFLSRPELVERSIREHRTILQALQSRDAAQVEALYQERVYGILEYANVVHEQQEEWIDERNDSLSK